jgi:hypothetical protein
VSKRPAIVIAVAAALLLPAAACADTVTMGSTLVNPYSGGVSTSPTVSIQQSYQAGVSANPIVSPANGVVTAWAVKSGDADAFYTLRIIRPTGIANTYAGAGSSPASGPVPNTVAPTGTILNYTASLPIKLGDSIGLLQGGLSDVGLPQFQSNGLTSNVIANNFTAQPIDGGTALLTPDQQHELLLQATVKFCKAPDLNRVKSAEAQQALAAADCTSTTKKKKLKRTRKNKKKKGKVLAQSLAPGATAAPGTPVELTVGKLKKK